jgi:hypothetical protein
VDLDPTTAKRLRALSGFVDDTDLAIVVSDLARSAMAAVPSFLAMRVTIHGAEQSITVATQASRAGTVIVRSSLRLEISTAGEAGHHHRVVYLAERSGAFVAFKETSHWVAGTAESLFGDRIERLVVDGDVPEGRMAGFARESPNPLGAGDGQSSIERAVGVLMSCGFTAEAARVELDVRAEGSESTAVQEAQELLRSLRGTVRSARDPGTASP